MPVFSVEVIAMLEREGISEEEAKADIASAKEVPDLQGAKVLLSGRLCMYTCRRQHIFGRVDLVVEEVWFE